MKKVAVVGAGIAGLTAAYQLHRVGFDVVVYEKNEGVAQECSYANGGQVSVCNAEVWTRWAMVWKGLKWMFQPDAPLLIDRSLSLDKLRWLSGFMYHTAAGHYRLNTVKTIELGLLSRYEYQNIINYTAIEFDRRMSGMLHLYRSKKSLDQAKSTAKMFNTHGVEWNLMSASEIVSLDPALSHIEDLYGGYHTSSDWTGDAYKFCVGMQEWLERRGVKFVFGAQVAHVKPIFDKVIVVDNRNKSTSEVFDIAVLSNGHSIAKIAKDNNERLNVYPVKGYSITVPVAPDERQYAPRVSLLDDDAKIVTSRLGDDRLRIAGTAEIAGTNDQVVAARIEPLKRWVAKNLPCLDTENVTEWACLRPMASDMMPIVRQSKTKNIWYHGGHGHLGWTLSAATSKHLVEAIKKENT